jgi:ribosomal protein L37AE/L43A
VVKISYDYKKCNKCGSKKLVVINGVLTCQKCGSELMRGVEGEYK